MSAALKPNIKGSNLFVFENLEKVLQVITNPESIPVTDCLTVTFPGFYANRNFLICPGQKSRFI